MARKTIASGILALALAAHCGAAAEVQRFHLSQATAQLPDVKAYVDILDNAGNPIANPQSTGPSATLGGRALKFSSLTPFEKTGEGVAYVFVIDTSESIEPARFDNIRTAIESWVRSADPKDRVAIIEFAEKVQALSDFNDSREKTLAAAHKLARGGKRSLIYQALVDALEQSSRRDPGLPTRRAIVIVTDGKDEGSGLNADDVLEQARGSHVPIYAIGYSNLPPSERRQYLDELHRIAEKSGGDYAEVAGAGLADAFPGMKNTIRRVFVAAFGCADCAADGKKYRFEMQLEADSRVFSDGFDVQVIPPKPRAPVRGTVKPPWWKRPWWVYASGGLVLVLLVSGLWMWRRRRRRAKARRAAVTMPPPRFVGGIGGTPIVFETPTAGPTKPSEPSIRVRLTVVRGRNQGSTSELQMAAKLVIGRRSGCDLALSDDETVSSEHCEISWSNNRLVIRDLHSSNGTLVNGVPISGDQPLENGDRVGIGKTEYRVGVVSGSL